MDKLLEDLEAVALLAEKLPKDGSVSLTMYGDAQRAQIAALNFLRTHHAEIAEALADARRWRASHFADAPIVTVTGEQLRKGIRPGDYAVPWDWPITAKTKIRLIAIDAQHNSAREGE